MPRRVAAIKSGARSPHSKAPNGCNSQTEPCRTHSLWVAQEDVHSTTAFAINPIIGVLRPCLTKFSPCYRLLSANQYLW